jgi:hypothetical protein
MGFDPLGQKKKTDLKRNDLSMSLLYVALLENELILSRY